MPSAPSRRSFFRGCLVAASVSLAGCSVLAGDSERISDWAYTADLDVTNETAAERRVDARLYELDGEADRNMDSHTVTETPPSTQRPLFSREFVVGPGDSVRIQNVLRKRDEATAYRLVVRVDGRHVAVYAFQTQYGSGLVAIDVDIRSPNEVRFSNPTV